MDSIVPGAESDATLAQHSLDRDVEICTGTASQRDNSYEDDAEGHSRSVPMGSRATLLHTPAMDLTNAQGFEVQQVLEDERTLLEDNHLIDEHQDQRRRGSLFDILSAMSWEGRRNSYAATRGPRYDEATETSPLLPAAQTEADEIIQKWEEACASHDIATSWQRETKVLLCSASPLLLTFILQYSLVVAPVFSVGHLGTTELGAVSLATMTATIAGFAIFQGLATALDTLCAQAYGSGRPKLVGLQMQRMVIFLWLLTIPVSLIWVYSDVILIALRLDPEIAHLVCQYLRVLIFGVPGYAVFEAGKRYVQAQGMFSSSLYVLAICAPLNAFLNWYLVWHTDLGFLGAPVAAVISLTLLPIGLFVHVRFISVDGMSCWNGFTWNAWYNWGPMIQLAVPGLIMIEAEILASEILTFAASYFGASDLAAQSALATIGNLMFQLPFPLSIAGSTRIANLIGATLTDAAKISTKVTFTASAVIGMFNVAVLLAFRSYIPYLFTSDEVVISTVSSTLPIVAAFQLFDATSACCNGVLRGLGRQRVGGYVQLFCYYVVAMPVSLSTAFMMGWELKGLWLGIAFALGLVTVMESLYIRGIDWQRSVTEAQERNAAR